jgi:hypothetical protein
MVSRESPEGAAEAARLGLVGLASGVAVWATMMFAWEPLDAPDFHWDIGPIGLMFTHVSLLPGPLFGILVGAFLRARGLADAARWLAYIAASAVSNFIATNFAVNLHDAFDSGILLGMAAGLVGAGCLTALSWLFLPFVRSVRSCAWMLAAGTLLGGLLPVALESEGDLGWGFLLLYVAWQAGYAAALGTALPERGRPA